MRKDVALLICILGVGRCLSALDTPTPKSPNGPSPHSPLYEWTAVEGAEYYIIKTWPVDTPACPDNRKGHQKIGIGYDGHPPYYAVFSPKGFCNEDGCALQRIPSDRGNLGYGNPKIGTRMGNYMTLGLKGVNQFSWGLPEMQFSRRCGADKQTYNGDLYIWHWSIIAAKGLDRKTNTFREQSAESPQVSYSWDETAKAPAQPTKPSAPTNPPQAHPVTFVNQSGMTLYLYYFILPGGSVVQCQSFQNGGSMEPLAQKKFAIPPKQTGHFVFQKEPDPCPLSKQFTTRDVPGGSAKPETIVIGR